MRSFAFSSIQDQRAELERVRGRGGEELSFFCPPVYLPVYLSLQPCYKVSKLGVCRSPKANRQTDGFTYFNACTLFSSPPPSSHSWLGFFLVCFCHSLGCVFFLVWVYFWYPLTKSVTPAPLHYSVSLLRPDVPAYPSFWGFGVKDQFPK